MEIINYFLFFTICLFYPSQSSASKKLRLCVICEHSREVKIVLELFYELNGEIFKIYSDVQIGENFEIKINEKDEREIDNYILQFHVSVNPINNEFLPDENDENPADDQPYEDQFVQMDDIRSLHRTVKVELFRPNFSRLYVVNLGSADPPGRLNWNRRVFVEAENDAGNYHAFVYAFVQKNRRGFELEDERILLGFAPLEKLENANGQQMPKFTEYKLSIPVNLNRFFKHKIWFLDIDIYQYEEDKMKSSRVGDEAEKDCSICLDEITKEQFCIKLHGENANAKMHIFHRNCINKWFSLLDRLRCPLCNQQPNRVLSIISFSLFCTSSDLSSNLFMNPISELFRIAKGQGNDGNDFKKLQAEHAIDQLNDRLYNITEKLKSFLPEMQFDQIIPFSDAKFFEICSEGIVENGIIKHIRESLEEIVRNQENSQQSKNKHFCKFGN